MMKREQGPNPGEAVVFDTHPPTRDQTRYRATSRSLVARARAPVWLGLALMGCLLLTGGGLGLRSAFRDRYVPPTPDFGAAAILPTLAPTPTLLLKQPTAASGQGVLYWTTLMVRQADGSYAPPQAVGQVALARFNKAVDAINRLPWQPFVPGDLFTPDGQSRVTQAMAQRDAAGSNFYAVLIPGTRQARVVGCNVTGDRCQVMARFGNVQITAYDGSTHAMKEQLALPREVTYTFAGQMVYQGDRWVVNDLTIPQDGDGQS